MDESIGCSKIALYGGVGHRTVADGDSFDTPSGLCAIRSVWTVGADAHRQWCRAFRFGSQSEIAPGFKRKRVGLHWQAACRTEASDSSGMGQAHSCLPGTHRMWGNASHHRSFPTPSDLRENPEGAMPGKDRHLPGFRAFRAETLFPAKTKRENFVAKNLTAIAYLNPEVRTTIAEPSKCGLFACFRRPTAKVNNPELHRSQRLEAQKHRTYMRCLFSRRCYAL